MNRLLAIMIAFLICGIESFSQNSDALIIGKVIDAETLESIPNAHIFNLRSNQGLISNQDGTFLIMVQNSDYIKITHIAYYEAYHQIKNQTKDTLYIKIYRKTYQLESVTVYPWSKEEFKFKFVHTDFKQDSIDKFLKKITVPKEELVQLAKSTAIISIPISYKTSKERQIIILNDIKNWVEKENEYRELITRQIIILNDIKNWVEKETEYRELITKITGYQAEELNAFIMFCNFSKRYIMNARAYYLGLAIEKKYFEFEQKKVNQKK